MSDPAASPPAAETPAPKKKLRFLNKDGKFRPGEKLRGAILEIAQRKRAGWKPEYAVVAARHGVKEGTLKKMVALHEKGELEMSSTPPDIEKKKLALATENERAEINLLKYERYLNDVFEDLLKKAEKERKEENYLAFDQLGIPKVLSEMLKTRSIRNAVQKGNFAALEQLMELHRIRQQQLETPPAPGQVNLTQNIVNINGAPATTHTPAARAELLTSDQQSIRGILSAAPGAKEIPATATAMP